MVSIHKIDKDTVEFLDTEFDVPARWTHLDPDNITLLYTCCGRSQKVKEITTSLEGLYNVLVAADKARRKFHYEQGAGIDELSTYADNE